MAVSSVMSARLQGKCFSLVIFDMDGVLVATSPCHQQAYGELWASLGLTGPDYAHIAGRRTEDVVAEYTHGLQPSQDKIRAWTAFKQRQARHLIGVADICFDDTISSLERFKSLGVQLALGTAASRETVEVIFDRYGFGKYFSSVVTAAEVSVGKPAPDIFRQVLHDTNTPPNAALVVEDSVAGVTAAIGAEAYVVSVRTGVRGRSPLFLGAFKDVAALLAGMEVA
jgi:beta-phosphoglucomutase-like phosphatase (HAD superfamily)